MSPPSPSLILDLAFPPEECVWTPEAENYVRYGNTAGDHTDWMGYQGLPYLAGMYQQ